jgi:succinate dehydrogenase / fumarate reductase, cytochrome b subunit
MPTLGTVIWSSVGKKFINAVAGLGLCAFISVHLLGNLALLTGNAVGFNKYAHFLTSTGVGLYFVEGGLVLFFLCHIITGTAVWWSKQVARPDSYRKSSGAGGNSRMNLASKTMIYTGALMLIFTVYHLITFKYGPGIDQGYVMTIDGIAVRDLYRLTLEVFSKPAYVIFYVVMMILLGYHLWHGFWSAFQSLGVNHPRYTPVINGVGMLFAVVMACGFLILPIVIFLRGGVA